MTEQKFCKDCKFFKKEALEFPPVCTKEAIGQDLVFGQKYYQECKIERFRDNRCSEQGKWWEPRANPSKESVETETYWQKLKTYFQ